MLAMLAPAIISAIFKEGLSAFTQYQQGKITLVQLQTKLAAIAMQEATKREAAYADTIKTTYPAFMQAVVNSRLVRWVWAITMLSQLGVLTFHEVGIPFIVWYTGHSYPSSGELIKWAYALLAFGLGGGAVVMKTSAVTIDKKTV